MGYPITIGTLAIVATMAAAVTCPLSRQPVLAQTVASPGDYAILRWGEKSVKGRMGKGAKVSDGHVCVDVLSMRRQSTIGSASAAESDAVALRTSRAAMRFAKQITVASDVITGGGRIRGEQHVSLGGRIDTSGNAPEITPCTNAADYATAKYTEFTNPALVSTTVPLIYGGGQQMISAMQPGCNVIDIERIRLRKDGTLTVAGGPLTQAVIVRVGAEMHLGRRAKITLQGLTPEQVLFVVEGLFTSRPEVEIRGSVMGDNPVWIGRGGIVEGQLLSSHKVVLRRFSTLTHKPFVDWFGTCGLVPPTPSPTAAPSTSTPGPTASPPPTTTMTALTDTPTGSIATATPTATAPTEVPTDTTATPTSTPTGSVATTTATANTPTGTPTSTMASPNDTPSPTGTIATATASPTEGSEPSATVTHTATQVSATQTHTATQVAATPTHTVMATNTPTNPGTGPASPGTAEIAHTGTTCQEFRDGTGEHVLPFVQYALRDGVINNVNPGVFFYYAAVLSPTSGPFVITVDQANTHSWPFIPPNQLQGILYDSSCTKVQNVTVSYEQALGVARIVVNGSYAANSTYYFSVKYSPTASYANNNGLGGFAPIGTPTVSYTYTAFVNGIDATDDASVALVPK